MSFYEPNLEEIIEANDEEYSSSNYITTSGIYPVEIKAVIVDQSPNGSISLSFWVEYKDQPQTIFNAIRLTNNDGSRNFQAQVFDQLLVIAGVEELDEPVTMKLPIGKGGSKKQVKVLEDLSDIECKIRVQFEYSLWKGEIREHKIIKAFYRMDDNATAKEILDHLEPARYKKDLNKANTVRYKDGLTEEAVKKWKEELFSKRNNKSEEESTSKSKLKFGRKFKVKEDK